MPALASLPAQQATVDLYAADFLAGFTLPSCSDFDDWQAFHAESLRQSLRAVLEKLACACAAAGEDKRGIAVAHRWLVLDPLDEGAHRVFMQLYAWSGQQSAALRQYERCVEILNREMGVMPDDTTQRASLKLSVWLLPRPSRRFRVRPLAIICPPRPPRSLAAGINWQSYSSCWPIPASGS